MHLAAILGVVALLGAATACTEGPEQSACIAGTQQRCGCPGDAPDGVQVCASDGSGFGACSCGGGGAGGAGGTAGVGSGGAPGGGAATGGGGAAGGSAVGEPCDATKQNCPGGLKCIPQSGGDGKCAENGSLPDGASCTALHPEDALDDCAADLLCVDSVCRPICDPSGAPCPTAMSCVSHAGNFAACLPWCDPLAQNCATGGCYYLSDRNGQNLVCAPAGNIAEDSPCPGTYANECAPGNVCAACGGGTFCCKPFCDTNQPALQCSGTEACTGLTLPAPYDHVGVCIS